jgi:hypothetical protein
MVRKHAIRIPMTDVHLISYVKITVILLHAEHVLRLILLISVEMGNQIVVRHATGMAIYDVRKDLNVHEIVNFVHLPLLVLIVY